MPDPMTCEDRDYRCCDLTPPPPQPTSSEYLAWYDDHVQRFNEAQTR